MFVCLFSISLLCPLLSFCLQVRVPRGSFNCAFLSSFHTLCPFLNPPFSTFTCCFYTHYPLTFLLLNCFKSPISKHGWNCLLGYFAATEMLYRQKLTPKISLIFLPSHLFFLMFGCTTLPLLLRSAAWDNQV